MKNTSNTSGKTGSLKKRLKGLAKRNLTPEERSELGVLLSRCRANHFLMTRVEPERGEVDVINDPLLKKEKKKHGTIDKVCDAVDKECDDLVVLVDEFEQQLDSKPSIEAGDLRQLCLDLQDLKARVEELEKGKAK